MHVDVSVKTDVSTSFLFVLFLVRIWYNMRDGNEQCADERWKNGSLLTIFSD